MRQAILLAVLVAACGRQEPASVPATNTSAPAQSGAWSLESSDEGAALTAAGANGQAALRLFCPAGEDRLVVNVPAFDPVGSEERMTFGQGGTAVTLVADPSGDPARGGVSGEGPVPDNLAQLLSGQVAVNYGAQNSGPHPAPAAALVSAFAGVCSGEASNEGEDANGQQGSQPPGPAPTGGSACLTGRDGSPVPANRIRALGTEPFWAAQVEGRCVTYSTPENQAGVRIWTQFQGTSENGRWAGALDGQPFVMITRPRPGCSDGMSDNRYPIEVALTVRGEQRSGCAEPR